MKNRSMPWICFVLLVWASTLYAGSAQADSDSLSTSTLQQDKEHPEGDEKEHPEHPEGDEKEHPEGDEKEHPEGE
jgi:hypothetical protein